MDAVANAESPTSAASGRAPLSSNGTPKRPASTPSQNSETSMALASGG